MHRTKRTLVVYEHTVEIFAFSPNPTIHKQLITNQQILSKTFKSLIWVSVPTPCLTVVLSYNGKNSMHSFTPNLFTMILRFIKSPKPTAWNLYFTPYPNTLGINEATLKTSGILTKYICPCRKKTRREEKDTIKLVIGKLSEGSSELKSNMYSCVPFDCYTKVIMVSLCHGMIIDLPL